MQDGAHDSIGRFSSESDQGACHAPRGNPPRHCDHRRRAGQRRLLRARARAAPGQEDGQPGRPDRLPPVLRGRARIRRPDITFFEYPGARRGPRGRGHGPPRRLPGRVRGGARLLGGAPRRGGHLRPRADGSLRSPTPRARPGAGRGRDRRRAADRGAPGDPGRAPLQGFDRVRALSATRRRAARFLEEALGSRRAASRLEARGEQRGGRYGYDTTRPSAGIPGAGTVHHVAWASSLEEHEAWRERAIEGGARADAGDRPLLLQVDLLPRAERRPVRDRDLRPGFTTDEPLEPSGSASSLPPDFEHLREQVEPVLTPITNPRDSWAAA